MYQSLKALSLGRPASASEDLFGKLTFAAGVFFVVLELSYFLMAGRYHSAFVPLDGFDSAIGRDFINTWMGGRSAFSGGPAPWFDFNTYNAMLRQAIGYSDFPDLFWSKSRNSACCCRCSS
jgi:alpha-1,2-mannosyltransferase